MSERSELFFPKAKHPHGLDTPRTTRLQKEAKL